MPGPRSAPSTPDSRDPPVADSGTVTSTSLGRRKFLARSGSAATATAVVALGGTTALAGCAAPFREAPTTVAGVEWKSIRATRENRNRKLVESQPTEPVVGDDAPVDVDLQNVAYDDEFVTFPESGSLVVDDDRAARIEEFYDDVSYAIVLTAYEAEPVADLPRGNTIGYHATREAFNRVDPGDRIVFRADPAADAATIDELVAVTEAGE